MTKVTEQNLYEFIDTLMQKTLEVEYDIPLDFTNDKANKWPIMRTVRKDYESIGIGVYFGYRDHDLQNPKAIFVKIF